MNNADIENLVQKYKNNDKDSLFLLFDAFQPYIYKMINKYYVYGFEHDDLKHECFLYLVDALNKYNGTTTFVAYATKTIKNNLNYLLRKQLKCDTVHLNGFEIQDNFKIDAYLEEKELVHCLQESLSTLSIQDQQILQDYYIHDLSLVTIAKKHNLKYITVAKKKDRAITKLKQLL